MPEMLVINEECVGMETKKTVVLIAFIIMSIAIEGCAVANNNNDEFLLQHNSDVQSVIKSKTSNKYSSEGASLLSVYSDNNEMKYLSVDIMGEMGRTIYAYTFTEGSVIITCSEDVYTEPFYINPNKIQIEETRHKMYVILNDKVYDYSNNEEMKLVSEEVQKDMIDQMNDFIDTMEEDE